MGMAAMDRPTPPWGFCYTRGALARPRWGMPNAGRLLYRSNLSRTIDAPCAELWLHGRGGGI